MKFDHDKHEHIWVGHAIGSPDPQHDCWTFDPRDIRFLELGMYVAFLYTSGTIMPSLTPLRIKSISRQTGIIMFDKSPLQAGLDVDARNVMCAYWEKDPREPTLTITSADAPSEPPPDWMMFRHNAPGECPCGIKTHMCSYHGTGVTT